MKHLFFSFLFLFFSTVVHAGNSCPTSDTLIDANGRTSTGWTSYIHDSISDPSDVDYYKIVLTERTQLKVYVNNKTWGGKKTHLKILASNCSTVITSKSGTDYTSTKTLDAGTYYAKVYYYNGTTDYKIRAKFPYISDLEIDKSVDNASVTTGDSVVFTLIAKNNGPTESDIEVTDTIPSGFTIDSITEDKSSFSCSNSGNSVTCNGNQNFSTNEEVNIVITTTASTAGNYTNTAQVKTTNKRSEPNLTNNSDSVAITVTDPVNQPPTASATVSPSSGPEGTDFTFDGTGSTDDGGAANLSYVWKEGSTVLSSSASFSKSDFSVGSHTIELTVTDNGGLSDSMHVSITVNTNQAPVADAGSDQTVLQDQNITLDGSGSHDDGGIVNYTWDVNGHTYSGIHPTVNGSDLHTGNNDITLTVTDETGKTDTDTVRITVTEVIENADDLCYEKPISTGMMCMDMGICKGGIGCKNTYPLKNVGDSNLTNVTAIYDESGLGGSFGSDCGVDPSGSCQTVHDIAFGPFGFFGTATEYDLDNTIPPEDNNNSIWAENFMSGSCFNGENLYGTYMKDGKLHRGKLHLCHAKYECANPKAFSIIHQENTQGNIKLIGNTNICRPKDNDPSTGECVDPGDATNNSTNAIWRKGDSNSNTNNSSAAKLVLPAGSKIIWAGLYWQGYFALSNSNKLAQAQQKSPEIKLGFTFNKGLQNVTYTSLTADRLNHVYFSSSRWYYQGFKDVTDYVQAHGTGWYWGADLQTTLGKPAGGTLGAWSIAIIYNDENDTIKNLTVFDGYLALAGNNDVNNAISYANAHNCDANNTGVQHETEMYLDGFKTPREGTVNSRLIFFGGEGDIGLTGDNLWLMDEHDTYHKIENSTNPNNNIANSSITDYNVRRGRNLLYPYYGYNTIGIDIDTFDVSDIIGNNQTHTSAKMNTSGDGYFPGIFGLSTDLYTPQVCYDYAVKRKEFLIPSEGRKYDIYANKNDEISVTIAIWDIKGDIDPRLVSIGLPITQTKGSMSALANKAYYTITNSNTLLQTDLANPMSTPNRPVITIGKGRTANQGGTISPDERYYTKYYFKVNDTTDSEISGRFNVEVNGTMNYGSGDFWQILKIDRCPQSAVYNPTWYQFNVEKVFYPDPVPSDNTVHYSLPTRIAGEDFDYSVASYTKDTATGEYTDPASANGITIDVEMIDIGAFDDNNSLFKCNNAEPNIIVMPGKFIYFDNDKTRVPVTNTNDLINTYAIRNATFRMWVLLDENGTIITDNTYHSKHDDAYFKDVYDTYFRTTQDVNGLCATACSTYNYESPRYPKYDNEAYGCYACLRDYFAQPYCARDNFSIRPKAIRVALSDRGKEANLTAIKIAQNTANAIPPAPDDTVALAAEYSYEANLSVGTKGYYTSKEFQEEKGLTSLPVKRDTSVALLKFSGSQTACADTTHSTIRVRFDDGTAIAKLKHDNVGNYGFEIWDSNWTAVDRAYANPNKTLFDPNCKESSDARCNDCTLGKTTDETNNRTDEEVGCTFSSALTHLDGSVNNDYTELNLTFRPYAYRFDGNWSVENTPNLLDENRSWVYMNDLSQSTVMATKLEGNITAIGAKDGTLTNYTYLCAAEDVLLALDFNSTPSSVTDASGAVVQFEQAFNGTVANADANTSVSKDFFHSNDNGSAVVSIKYNFKKPYSQTVNPAQVNYINLTAASPDASSYADQNASYLPKGEHPIGDSRYFYFAQVAPSEGTDGRQEYGASVTTVFRVMTYCDNTSAIACPPAAATSSSAEPLPGIATIPESDWLSWYRTTDHTSANGDGQINTITTALSGVSITPGSNITFDTNGTTGAVTITYPTTSTRPVHPLFIVTPDEWLKYNSDSSKNGLPQFIINFLTQGLRWKGKGETGHVMETEPSTKSSGRLNW